MSSSDTTDELEPQFNPAQQAEALKLIERCAWGSMEQSIIDLESALRIAMEMTRHDFLRWEDEVKPALEDEGNFDDHLFVVRAGVELSDEDRRAYLAGLVKELALAWGLRRGGQENPSSPAGLLCGLNDISWIPTTATP